MMVCPNCGEKLRKEENYYEGVLYCPKCGVGQVFRYRPDVNTSNTVLSYPHWLEGKDVK